MPVPDSRRAARLATLTAVPVALLVGVLAFWLLGGFGKAGPRPGPGARPQSTEPVTMPAPPLSERAATVCRALLSQLPDSVRELRRRPVTAGAEQNAAYGDPAITMACAAGPVPSFPPDATLWGLSGVCWYAVERGGTSVWTTVDREVPVTVAVPAGYAQPGQWVIEFSAPVVASVPSAVQIPSGCR